MNEETKLHAVDKVRLRNALRHSFPVARPLTEEECQIWRDRYTNAIVKLEELDNASPQDNE
jgi:hypothetical protein